MKRQRPNKPGPAIASERSHCPKKRKEEVKKRVAIILFTKLTLNLLDVPLN